MVSNEIIPDLDVPSVFASRHLTISCKQHCALVVLVNHVVNDLETLPLKEQLGPDDQVHSLVHPH